jgi:diketogulonate reductase-like aldo/keto reductase
VLKAIADRHNSTPRQVALGFLTRRASLFAIPKAADPEHAEENAGAATLNLSAAEMAKIDAAFPLGARPRSLPML